MFTDLKTNVKDWESDEEITAYLQKILNKEAFDHAGLIYGMGHAVYTLSDPREVILKRFAQALAEEKGMMEEFKLYDKVESIAGKLIMEHRRLFKNVAQMLTSTVVSFTQCLVFRKNFLLRSLPSHVCLAGVHIVWKN